MHKKQKFFTQHVFHYLFFFPCQNKKFIILNIILIFYRERERETRKRKRESMKGVSIFDTISYGARSEPGTVTNRKCYVIVLHTHIHKDDFSSNCAVHVIFQCTCLYHAQFYVSEFQAVYQLLRSKACMILLFFKNTHYGNRCAYVEICILNRLPL